MSIVPTSVSFKARTNKCRISSWMLSRFPVSRNAGRKETARGKIAASAARYNDDNDTRTPVEERKIASGEVALAWSVKLQQRQDEQIYCPAPKSHPLFYGEGASTRAGSLCGIEKNIGCHARVGTWIDREEIVVAVASPALAASPRKTVRRESLSRPEGTLWPQNRTIGQVDRERKRERERRQRIAPLYSVQLCSFVIGYWIYFACLSTEPRMLSSSKKNKATIRIYF